MPIGTRQLYASMIAKDITYVLDVLPQGTVFHFSQYDLPNKTTIGMRLSYLGLIKRVGSTKRKRGPYTEPVRTWRTTKAFDDLKDYHRRLHESN